MVENVRVGRRVFQRRALYLGELNDSQRAEWQRAVIALVLTPDGFPLAYEVLPGNAHDKGAQMQFIRKLEAKYGKISIRGSGTPSKTRLN